MIEGALVGFIFVQIGSMMIYLNVMNAKKVKSGRKLDLFLNSCPSDDVLLKVEDATKVTCGLKVGFIFAKLCLW